MKDTRASRAAGRDTWLPSLTDTLHRPVATWVCVLSWVASSGLFVALVEIFRGPSYVDINESVYSTWAIAHGHFACAYPPVSPPGAPPIAPLYPLLSGGLSALVGIGRGTPFPSAATLGPACHNAYSAMNQWAKLAGALPATTRIGCLCWLALLTGVVLWLRASGRGRRRWEPLTVMVVAALLPVWMCVQTFFHPQDLLALGLGLSAVASARRGRWPAAGVLCALAILSQQFALLVAAPLVVVAPATKRATFVLTGLVTAAVVVLPMALLMSGRVIRAVALGTGDYPTYGGTVLWETHANGAAGVLLYRVAPIAVALAVSLWVARRLGPAVLGAVPLMSLVALCLALRLVFEVNFLTYYFMAVTVALVLLDVSRGSIRRGTVAWIGALTVVICRMSIMPFGTVAWGGYMENDLLPLFVGGLALLAILTQLLRGGARRDLWPWVCLAVVVLITLSPVDNAYSDGQVVWFWQIVLTVPAVVLAAQPLRAALRDRAPGTGVPDLESTLHSAP